MGDINLIYIPIAFRFIEGLCVRVERLALSSLPSSLSEL